MEQEALNIDKAKHNEILRLFIGFIQNQNHGLVGCSVDSCAAVLHWLSSNKIDVYQENWVNIEAEKLKLPEDLSYRRRQTLPKYFVLKLNKALPLLLKSNGNIKYIDENGKTFLHAFLENLVEKSDFSLENTASKILEMVKYLMSQGISVNSVDNNGNTPLHFAAKLMSTELMEMMLKNCVDLNIQNKQGDAILHLVADNCVDLEGAPIQKYAELAQLMLSKGADVNLQNNEGWAPLHFAAKRNHLYMIELFVENQANLKLLAEGGENALLLSCKHKSSMKDADIPSTSVEILLRGGCDVNATNAKGYSSLYYISMQYDFHIANLLIEAGANVHCKTKDYLLTPLHRAAHYGDFEITKMLVDAGADVNDKAVDNVTPLFFVVSRVYDARLTEYLIEKGADIHCREKVFGFTLIHIAALCLHSDNKSLRLLLDQGLDVNDGGKYGITALHLASFHGKDDVVKILIEYGADVNCRDNLTHSTPLHFASKEGEILDFIDLIVGIEHKPFWGIISPTIQDTEGVIKLLVLNGADVHAKDTFGRTSLHLATLYIERHYMENRRLTMSIEFHNRNIDSTRGLLKCGAYMDAQDNEGNLPLHNALKTEHEKALKTLLDFNVDVNEDDTSSIVLSCKEETQNQVLKHVVKLKVADLPVSNKYIPHIDKLELQSYYGVCLKEVEKMKAHLIDNVISLYDLLHMNWKRLNFVEKLPDDLEVKYPIYNGIIQSSFQEALQRRLLFEPANEACCQLTKIHLPEICVEYILDYLKNRYLRVLVDSLM